MLNFNCDVKVLTFTLQLSSFINHYSKILIADFQKMIALVKMEALRKKVNHMPRYSRMESKLIDELRLYNIVNEYFRPEVATFFYKFQV